MSGEEDRDEDRDERVERLERRLEEIEQREHVRSIESRLLGSNLASLSAVPAAIDPAKATKFDSLVPMNEEQLQILRRSEEERKKRAEADKEKQAADARWREYRRIVLALLAFLTISMQVVFEVVRAASEHYRETPRLEGK